MQWCSWIYRWWPESGDTMVTGDGGGCGRLSRQLGCSGDCLEQRMVQGGSRGDDEHNGGAGFNFG